MRATTEQPIRILAVAGSLREESVNVPRSHVRPKCLTRKPATEWTGSSDQVPVAMGVVVAVVMEFLPSG